MLKETEIDTNNKNNTQVSPLINLEGAEPQIELNLEEYSLLSELIYGQLIGILILMTLVLGIVLVLILLMINSPNKNNVNKS